MDSSNQNSSASSICSPPDAKRMKTEIRDTMNSVKLSVLLAAHSKYYSEWSNGRKKAGKQLIPKEIWPKVRTITVFTIKSSILHNRLTKTIRRNFLAVESRTIN